jgi:hypothetical protein
LLQGQNDSCHLPPTVSIKTNAKNVTSAKTKMHQTQEQSKMHHDFLLQGIFLASIAMTGFYLTQEQAQTSLHHNPWVSRI